MLYIFILNTSLNVIWNTNTAMFYLSVCSSFMTTTPKIIFNYFNIKIVILFHLFVFTYIAKIKILNLCKIKMDYIVQTASTFKKRFLSNVLWIHVSPIKPLIIFCVSMALAVVLLTLVLHSLCTTPLPHRLIARFMTCLPNRKQAPWRQEPAWARPSLESPLPPT